MYSMMRCGRAYSYIHTLIFHESHKLCLPGILNIFVVFQNKIIKVKPKCVKQNKFFDGAKSPPLIEHLKNILNGRPEIDLFMFILSLMHCDAHSLIFLLKDGGPM